MDIKSKFLTAVLLVIILLTGFQCSNDSKLLENIPISTSIDNCPDIYHDFGDIVSVGDPNAKFIIRVPYSWDIRESYTDSLYGVAAANYLSIPVSVEERMGLSVNGYTTDKELDQYVHDELIDLIKEEKTKVLERGITMFAGMKNPWVLFNVDGELYNMVYYVKEADNNDIYLIQTICYDTVNYRNKMCYMKQLVNSFSLMEDE